ncbi:glycosyltransferase family 4 protein, partial [Terribacillus saccharophilus]
HTHGAEFESYFNGSNNKNKIKIKELLSNSDAVIALGTNWENIIKKIESSSRTIILRNAVDLPIPFEKSYNNKKHIILFLAVLIERKGILDLIEAAKFITKNGNVEFVIAGDGELFEESVKVVKSAGLEKKFKFVGWVNEKEKNDLLRRADLFVLPSYNEGLPLSILEAMSFYLPIVSTNVGSIDEAVKNKENGELVQPGSVKELEKAILNVLEPKNLLNYSKKSRQMAEEMFDNKEYFLKIEKLYASVTEG